MAIVVEDGTLVSGANSYSSVADFKTWADARGITYGTDEVIGQQMLRSMDYLETLDYQGLKADENQALQWPRDQVYIDGYAIEANEIPKELKAALYECIKTEIDSDSRLTPVEREVLSEKVDSIQVTYKSSTGMKRQVPALTYALKKLIKPVTAVSRA